MPRWNLNNNNIGGNLAGEIAVFGGLIVLLTLLLEQNCDLFFGELLFRCFVARTRCLISVLPGQTLAGRETVVNSEQIFGRAAAQQISSQEANFSKQAELMRTLNTHTHTHTQLSV